VISRNSRYITAQAYTATTDGSNRTLIDTSSRSVVTFTGGSTYQVKQGDTLEGIAYTQYGDASKWWEIADANDIFNPLFDLTVGTLLNIPTL
jgi:nucleoid-associated protein YgaU